MRIESITQLPEIMKIEIDRRFEDERGYFFESYRKDVFKRYGIECRWVQENHSLSLRPGVIRGLHFQRPPMAQAKLVRVAAGAILDVVVDIRHGSPTWGQHITLEISAVEGTQLFIPEGFAHGFCALEPNTVVIYKVNNYYSKEHESGLLWSDFALGITWPAVAEKPVLSEKDRSHCALADLPVDFRYLGP